MIRIWLSVVKKFLTGSFFICVFYSASAADSTHVKKLSVMQIREDLSQMVQLLEAVHPNPYHDISKERFLIKYDSIISTIKDSLTVVEAWPKFAVLLGSINEGHTSIFWPREILEPDVKYMPVLFQDYERGSFIVRFHASDSPQLKPGDRVIAINGESSESLMNRFFSYSGGLSSWKQRTITFFLEYYLAITNPQNVYRLKVSTDEGEKEIVLDAVSKSSIDKYVRAYKRSNPSSEPYQFNILEENIAYLNFRSMDNYEKFSRFVDSVFADIKKNPIKGLIIDLRQNSGGNSVLGDKLLEYLTRKKYRMSAAYKWKISQAYKDYYNSLKMEDRFMKGEVLEENYLKGRNGDLIEQKFSEKKPTQQANRYKGKVCFLISPNTFSSANMLANAIGDYKLFPLIGEPSGEPPNDYGEILSLTLPNTGIRFFTSTKHFIRANGNADDPNPVLPDYPVKNDPSTKADEQLEFAKKWILMEK